MTDERLAQCLARRRHSAISSLGLPPYWSWKVDFPSQAVSSFSVFVTRFYPWGIEVARTSGCPGAARAREEVKMFAHSFIHSFISPFLPSFIQIFIEGLFCAKYLQANLYFPLTTISPPYRPSLTSPSNVAILAQLLSPSFPLPSLPSSLPPIFSPSSFF